MKISFISTIFNEERTIQIFLDSLCKQTTLPSEIIIVDGGSYDGTIAILKKYKAKYENTKVSFRFIIKKGNRSVGRNEAIRLATGDIIVCSDAGNILDKNWVKNISKPYIDKSVDVVAGYYRSRAKNVFQKALTPFVLVMEDKVDPNNFLPATRSVAFTKKIWKKVGRFNEKYSHNEDYVFARALKESGARIVFQKNAIVEWIPRNTYKEAFIMFFRFAYGDVESKILRFKVFLLILRYFLVIYLFGLSIFYKNLICLYFIITFFVLYILYAIIKNYKYVNDKKSFIILPLLQLVADCAVISGSFLGFLKLIYNYDWISVIKNNVFLISICSLYVGIMLLTINYGIPNQNHPYPYNMDEWHQLQAVRATAKFGTPNVAGAANGTMLHFILGVLYILPFTFLHYINPAVIKINDLAMRERIFELLRLTSIFYGIMAMIFLDKIAAFLRISRKLTLLLFTFTPIYLYLSGYFKYDIDVLFLIILSIYFMLRFTRNPDISNLIYTSIVAGLAFSVKVSSIPLLPIIIVTFIMYYPLWYRKLSHLFLSGIFYICTILLFGTPDILFGKGNFFAYFYQNVITVPDTTSNLNLGMNQFQFLYSKEFPLNFGYGLIIMFLIAVISFIVISFKSGISNVIKKHKNFILIFLSFIIFFVSIIPLKLYGNGNRSIVLLPFFVLISNYIYTTLYSNKFRKIFIVFMAMILFIQFIQTYAWLSIKTSKSPQEISSNWLVNNIPHGATIGIENMPIYQSEPEIIEKEYYYMQNKVSFKNIFNYTIIDENTIKLPNYIVLTNGEIDAKVNNKSPMIEILNKMHRENYRKIASFIPDYGYYRFFGNEIEYYYSFIDSTPVEISVYKKY